MEICALSDSAEKVNVLVLVSGGGTNLQALIDAEKSGALGSAHIALVVSDRKGAYALVRAEAAGIAALVEASDLKLPKPDRRLELSNRILRLCHEHDIGFIVHAGFLSILAGSIIGEYAGRMINIHPALLPAFGGQGMYGDHVHRAVLASGAAESGCTVHLVENGIDTGRIILQRKVPVLAGDTPESLAARIHIEEHKVIVEAVKILTQN